MKIRYKIGAEDIVAFNLQHLNAEEKIKKKQLRGRIILSSVYGVIAIGLFAYEPGYWPFSWLLMFFAILWYIFYPKVWELRVRKKLLKAFKDRGYNSYELELDSEGIIAKSSERSGRILWSDVKSIVKTDQHIFIYLTKDDGVIISKSGLEDGDKWGELVACIDEYGIIHNKQS